MSSVITNPLSLEEIEISPPTVPILGDKTSSSCHRQPAFSLFISKFCDTFAFSHYANALFAFHCGGQKYRRVLPENVTTSFQKINYLHTNENAGIWQHVKKLCVTVKKNGHFPSAAVTMATGSALIDNSPSTSRRGDARILYSVL